MLGVFGKSRGLRSLVFHPNADSYRNLSPKQIYCQHENEKKRKYATRVLEVEKGTFTPLVFSTTGGMGEECQRFHSRLAELLASKQGENYSTTFLGCDAKFPLPSLKQLYYA